MNKKTFFTLPVFTFALVAIAQTNSNPMADGGNATD
jgi:hypothetical protein